MTPSALLAGWLEELTYNWPSLDVWLFHKSNPHPAVSRNRRIEARDTEYGPDIFPDSLKALFDPVDERTRRHIVLTTYETLANRTLVALPQDDPNQVVRHRSRLRGCFARVICDEGHKLKNPRTTTWRAVARLEVDCRWLVTATPMVNRDEDLGGLLQLLYRPEWEDDLDNHDHATLCNADFDVERYRKAARDPQHIRYRMVLKPDCFLNLLADPETVLVERAEVIRIILELVQLRRSYSTVLTDPISGRTVRVGEDIPPYQISTVDLRLKEEEQTEYLAYHRSLVCRLMMSAKDEVTGARRGMMRMAIFRQLALASTSLLLNWLVQRFHGGKSSEVYRWREEGFDLQWMMEHSGALPPNSTWDELTTIARCQAGLTNSPIGTASPYRSPRGL